MVREVGIEPTCEGLEPSGLSFDPLAHKSYPVTYEISFSLPTKETKRYEIAKVFTKPMS
jgi:hypothetical protein